MATNTSALRGLYRLLNIPKRRISGGPGEQKAPPRRSCAGEKLPPCAQCTPPPPPACRAEKKSSMSGVRVACHPPPAAHRPPCPPPQPPCTVTCDHLHTQNASKSSQQKGGCHITTKRCGDTLDRVAQRIAAAKHARRLDYEREVAARIKEGSRAPPVPAVNYLLGTEREVARATDGRDYVVLPSTDSATNSQNPQNVQLDPAKNCTIKRSTHVDPCAHQPRTLLEIKRSEVINISPPGEKNEKDKKNDAKGAIISKNQCKKNSVSKLSDWCSSPPEMAPDPSPCRQPTLVDRLKVQSKSSCNLKRKIHTIPTSFQSQSKQGEKRSSETEIDAIISKTNTDNEKFDKMMNERNELKESGRGRTGFLEHTEGATINGLLELQVPPGTHSVRVNVGLHAAQPLVTTPPRRCPTSTGGNNHNVCFGKNDSWLSIKNIQKKFSGCRKESTPTKNVDAKECKTRQPASTKPKQNLPKTICQPKASTEPSPCDRKQNVSTNPCQLKQKTKQSPCDTKPPTCTKKCSSALEIASNTIIST